jgi:hypothetical protein
MIGVAVVLILLVLIFGAAAVVSNSGPPSVSADGSLEFSIFVARVDATVPGIFFTGAVTMIILLLSILLLISGLRRARGQRQRIKALTHPAAATDSGKADPEPDPDQRPAVGAATATASSSTKDAEPAATAAEPQTASADRTRLLDEVDKATGPDHRPAK